MPETINIQRSLDTSGLLCPQPLLQAKQALNQMQAGEILEVITTDKSAVIDFAAFTQMTHNPLIKKYQRGEKIYFLIQKK